jgi:hypothetical protein
MEVALSAPAFSGFEQAAERVARERILAAQWKRPRDLWCFMFSD